MKNNVVRDDGTVRVRIIGPGQGASAYYEEDQLRRDMGVFARGTQVFFDHAGRREEADRPERSLRDLCGVTTTDPVWEEAGLAGPGPYTNVAVFEPYRPLIEEMGPHIGVSIMASGTITPKQVNGKTIRVAEKFTSGRFDFVTKAGAGGKVVMAEAARQDVDGYVDEFLAAHPQESETSESARALFIEWATGESTEEEDADMTEKLQEKDTLIAQLQEQLARTTEAMLLKEAAGIVETEISKADLPDVTKARLRESLAKLAPAKDAALDTEALQVAVTEAIKAEKAYIESLGPRGVVGMGQTAPQDGKAKLRESMVAYHIQNGETKDRAEKLADLATDQG